jgi:hypothetical protein
MQTDSIRTTRVVASLLANALILGVLAYVAILHEYQPDQYRAAVQEDEYLEWGTFWAFLGAAGICIVAAVRQRRAQGGVPWFLAGLGLFCFLVAGEEISWAQRIFAYQPPVYFLEHNFQQEPNLHNVIGTGVRKLTLKAIITGYGLLLPTLALIPAARRLLDRLGIVAPPAMLIPPFAAALYIYVDYPWKYSGETVELLLGLGFLFAALEALRHTGGGAATAWLQDRPLRIVVAWLLAMGLGWGTAAATRNQRAAWPENIALAETEVEALRDDFLARSNLARERFPSKCGLHKRVYSYVVKYEDTAMLEGRFAGLQQLGLPEERAEFFMDPWNAPYWVRHRCSRSTGRKAVFFYSFGPNRRRDSSVWEILGDDIGSYVFVDPGEDSDAEPGENGTETAEETEGS